MWASLVIFVVLVVMAIALWRQWLPPPVGLFGALTLLMVFGLVPPDAALRGFGSATVWSIASLLVLAAGVRRTGALGVLLERLLGRAAATHALWRMMLPAALSSAFMSNTPIVAMMTPPILDWCKRRDMAPSRYLMPLSFATILGGLCTLIGTSTTLVVDGMLTSAGHAGLGLFEMAWVGVPVMLAGMVLVWLLAGRLLPNRSDPMRNLFGQRREFLVEMLVTESSPLAGMSIREAGLRNLPGLFLMSIGRQGEWIEAVSSRKRLRANDRLLFTGIASTVMDLCRFPGLVPAPEAHYDPTAVDRRAGLYEVVISRSSPLVNTTIKNVGFRARYDAAVLAVHRAGHRLAKKLGDVVLRAGDTLIIEASEDFDRRWADSTDFALVARRVGEGPPRVRKTRAAVGIFLACILAVATGVLPLVVAGLLAVGCSMAFGVLTLREVREALDVSVITVVASAIGLGQALTLSGVADSCAVGFREVLGIGGPWALLVGVYVVGVLLSEVLTNVGAAALVFPVLQAALEGTDLALKPFAIVLAVAASASFLTPTGYQTNLMVYGPGGYRFGDYARLGAPLQVLVLVLTVTLVPVWWPLGGM